MGFQELALFLGYVLGLLGLTHLKINRKINQTYDLVVKGYLLCGIGIVFYLDFLMKPELDSYSFVIMLFSLLFGAILLDYIFIQKFSLALIVGYSFICILKGNFLNNNYLLFASIVMSINVLNLFISEQVDGFYERAYKEFNRCLTYSNELRKQRDLLEVKVHERTRQLEESRKADILKLNQMANLGKLSAGLTHEIVNPLTYIKFNLNLIKSETKSEEHIARAIKGVSQIDLLLQSFRKQLLNSRECKYFEVTKEIEGALALVHYKTLKYKIDISSVIEPVVLYGSSVRLNQVIVNLLANAIDACEYSLEKKIIINGFRQKNNYILQIQDSGLGVKLKNKKRIFEPLYTTKNIEKGTGLGLSICRQIIEEDFNGRINLKSLAHPTIFEIILPLT